MLIPARWVCQTLETREARGTRETRAGGRKGETRPDLQQTSHGDDRFSSPRVPQPCASSNKFASLPCQSGLFPSYPSAVAGFVSWAQHVGRRCAQAGAPERARGQEGHAGELPSKTTPGKVFAGGELCFICFMTHVSSLLSLKQKKNKKKKGFQGLVCERGSLGACRRSVGFGAVGKRRGAGSACGAGRRKAQGGNTRRRPI